MKIDGNLKKKYWDGLWNKITRYLFYLNQGTDHGINRYRNHGFIIMGVCLTLKITSWKFMIVAGVILLTVTAMFGYFHTHFMSQVMDFLGVHFATYQSKRSLELQEQTLEALQKLNERLSNGANPHHSNSHDILHKNP